MESTTDFEKLLFLYKTEWKGMSIQSFCINQGVKLSVWDGLSESYFYSISFLL